MALLSMKFNDMLKKKKKEDTVNTEEINDTVENNEQQDINEQAEENAASPVDLLKAEISAANDKYLRLYAEFDNFRRRTI